MIVVFPQGDVRGATNCWDVSGYSGDAYETTSGVQSKAIMDMIARLTESQNSSFDYNQNGYSWPVGSMTYAFPWLEEPFWNSGSDK